MQGYLFGKTWSVVRLSLVPHILLCVKEKEQRMDMGDWYSVVHVVRSAFPSSWHAGKGVEWPAHRQVEAFRFLPRNCGSIYSRESYDHGNLVSSSRRHLVICIMAVVSECGG